MSSESCSRQLSNAAVVTSCHSQLMKSLHNNARFWALILGEYKKFFFVFINKNMLTYIKGVIRCRKSKDRQYNAQKKKDK